MKNYEGLFLVSTPEAMNDLESSENHIKSMLAKCGSTVIRVERWPDVKLAYDIKGHGKGTYFLVYFESAPESIELIKRECNISEVVTRELILKLAGEIPPEGYKYKIVEDASDERDYEGRGSGFGDYDGDSRHRRGSESEDDLSRVHSGSDRHEAGEHEEEF